MSWITCRIPVKNQSKSPQTDGRQSCRCLVFRLVSVSPTVTASYLCRVLSCVTFDFSLVEPSEMKQRSQFSLNRNEAQHQGWIQRHLTTVTGSGFWTTDLMSKVIQNTTKKETQIWYFQTFFFLHLSNCYYIFVQVSFVFILVPSPVPGTNISSIYYRN